MLGKFGLILLVLLFGACMFVAGMMAPSTWRYSLLTVLGPHVPEPHNTSPLLAAKAGKRGASRAAVASPATSALAAPMDLDQLLIGSHLATPSPAKGQPAYALKLGQFLRDADVEAMARRAQAAAPDLPVSRITGVDATGQTWTVLAVGRYVSPQATQRDAARLQETLRLDDLPAIRLPPPSAEAGT